MAEAYHKDLVTIVFKTSTRSNAKCKIKSFRNKSIDDILNAKRIIGIPENAVILEMGMGIQLEQQYRKKYNL
jgi:hypothetical protein